MREREFCGVYRDKTAYVGVAGIDEVLVLLGGRDELEQEILSRDLVGISV